MHASRLRRFGAWYFDLALWTTGMAMLGAATGASDVPLLVSLLVFFPVRFLTARLGVTPGKAILAIDEHGEVDADVAGRESWLTCFVALGFFVGGINQLAHWATEPYPLPVFGYWPSGWWLVAADVALGSAMLAAAILLFRVRPLGWCLALGTLALCTASTVVDWSSWDEVVRLKVEYRRALQGLEVRPGEIEFMQAAFPESLLASSAVTALVLLITWRRFFAER